MKILKKNTNVSQIFMWGFEGARLTSELRSFLKHYPPAGLILFKRNIESTKQVKELTRQLQAACDSKLLIGIDEEGGRVSRVPEEMMKFPPAVFWGKVYQKEKDIKLIERFGQILGEELKSIGVNLDFAPVLDVNSNPKNPIIGDRAFSTDPKVVAETAIAFYRGLKKAGVLGCGKHFPGHGDTATDSHLTLPYVSRSKSMLEKVELYPFQQAILAGIPMLMTAHVVYKAFDSKSPATLSKKILQGILREHLKFKGIIISDDLQMKAVAEKYSETESSLLSLRAGVDLLMICRGAEENGAKVIEEVAGATSKDAFLEKRFLEGFNRIQTLKKQLKN